MVEVDKLTVKVELDKQSVDNYKRDAKDITESTEKIRSQTKKVKPAASDAGKSVEGAGKKAKETAKHHFQIFGTGLGQIKSKLLGLISPMRGIMAAFAAVASAVTAAAVAYYKYAKATANIKTRLNLPSAEVPKYQQAYRTLATSRGVGAEAAEKGLISDKRLNYSLEEKIEYTKALGKVSKLAGEDILDLMARVNDVFVQYKITGKDAADRLWYLESVSNKTGISMGYLLDTMSQLSHVAHGRKIDLKQFAAEVGVAYNKGADPAQFLGTIWDLTEQRMNEYIARWQDRIETLRTAPVGSADFRSALFDLTNEKFTNLEPNSELETFLRELRSPYRTQSEKDQMALQFAQERGQDFLGLLRGDKSWAGEWDKTVNWLNDPKGHESELLNIPQATRDAILQVLGPDSTFAKDVAEISKKMDYVAEGEAKSEASLTNIDRLQERFVKSFGDLCDALFPFFDDAAAKILEVFDVISYIAPKLLSVLSGFASLILDNPFIKGIVDPITKGIDAILSKIGHEWHGLVQEARGAPASPTVVPSAPTDVSSPTPSQPSPTPSQQHTPPDLATTKSVEDRQKANSAAINAIETQYIAKKRGAPITKGGALWDAGGREITPQLMNRPQISKNPLIQMASRQNVAKNTKQGATTINNINLMAPTNRFEALEIARRASQQYARK